MANPDVILRSEFESTMEWLDSRLTALEAAGTVQIDDAGRPTVSGQFELVTQNEFRLFKLFGGIVLAAVFGSLVVLYDQITDFRVEMRNLHSELIRELQTQFGALQKEMQAEFAALRAEDDSVRAEQGDLSRSVR